jgi:expansin (peptidoglycan-binding protein)
MPGVRAESAHSRPPVLRRRWLATGGAVVLAGVIGVALLVQNGGSAACAAPPTGNERHQGKATFYDLGGLGNCSFTGAPDDDLYVALGNAEYSSAAACGSYLDVTGPKGSVRVKVVDRCPECEEGHLDLSRTAFKRIADEVQGIIPITYKAAIDPGVPGPLSLRFKDGTSEFFFALLVDNHANPLRSVKVSSGGGTRTAKRADFNFWIIDGGAGRGPFSVTMTDVYGNKATATGVGLRPEQTQRTSVRLTGGGGTAAVGAASADRSRNKPPARKARPAARPTTAAPSVSVSASPSASTAASRAAARGPELTGTALGIGPHPDNALPGAVAAAPSGPPAGPAVALAGSNRACT